MKSIVPDIYQTLVLQIRQLQPGQQYVVTRAVYNRLFQSNVVAEFVPPIYYILERVVGSCYEYRFWHDHESGNIIIERLDSPIENGLYAYAPYHRRHLFRQRPDGFFESIF